MTQDHGRATVQNSCPCREYLVRHGQPIQQSALAQFEVVGECLSGFVGRRKGFFKLGDSVCRDAVGVERAVTFDPINSGDGMGLAIADEIAAT